MKKTNINSNYSVTVSGEIRDREKIAGKMVMNAGNLVTGIRNDKAAVVFFFRFKSDAKLVLRNVSKLLQVKQSASCETVFGGARAVVSKIA